MKLTASILIFFVTIHNINGQTSACKELKMNDLILLLKKDLNGFDSYARDRCYTHRSSGDLNGRGQEHNYQFRKGEIDNGDYVRYAEFKDGGKFIAYLTLSEGKFKALKDELPKIGFKSKGSKYEEEILYFTFESPTLTVSISQHPSGYKYHFSVYKKGVM